jgi:hypothetical protein
MTRSRPSKDFKTLLEIVRLGVMLVDEDDIPATAG